MQLSIQGKDVNCPICSNEKKQNPYITVNNYSSYKCSSCEHIYVNDAKLTDFDTSELYSGKFYENYMSGLGYANAYDEFLKNDFLKKIELMNSILKRGASILEVGSGPGFFAKLLSDAGYNVTAVELTPGAREYAEKTSNFTNIISEDLSDPNCSLYDDRFDCVISWAVIEHVYEVNDFVALLKKYTKKGGYIFVDTGIRTKFLSLVDRGYTSWLDPPHHLHVFSDKSITKLFRNNGLEIFYFKAMFNFSTSKLKILIRYIKELIKGLLDIKKVIKKEKPGRIAIIGLLIAKNN